MNARDFQNAFLQAQAELVEFFDKFVEEFAEPLVREQMLMMWSGVPQEARDRLKVEAPDDYQALMDFLGKD